MSLWILSGMSGAGKAVALAALERAGVTCIDNVPLEIALQLQHREAPTVAVVDARQPLDHVHLPEDVRVVFLDASDDVLVRRIGESTRPHPLEAMGRGPGAVRAEREALAQLRGAAHIVIDTTEMQPRELGERLRSLVLGADAPPRTLQVTVSSFGFKYGVQVEADWIIDVRMLRNPFWDPALRPLTGLDAPVRDFVLAQPEAPELLQRLTDLLRWSGGQYQEHGRHHLHVALGCTGGRHRSVVLAEALAVALREGGMDVRTRHRDVERPDPRDIA